VQNPSRVAFIVVAQGSVKVLAGLTPSADLPPMSRLSLEWVPPVPIQDVSLRIPFRALRWSDSLAVMAHQSFLKTCGAVGLVGDDQCGGIVCLKTPGRL